MKRREICTFALAAACAASVGTRALARGLGYFHKDGFALGGVDPVAYFHDGAVRPGQAAWQIDWHGVTWVFASAANLAEFESTPRCFAPQFGGHCAFGMSEGRLLAPDLQAFAIYDKRLYLTSSPAALQRWQKDPAERVLLARANWALLS